METDIFTFEDYGEQNGIKFWWASVYSKMLGYTTLQSFMNPVNKAIQACMSAKIDYFDDFRHVDRIVDGKPIRDIKLSRFACYMVAMNSDPKKEVVAKAQVYFADQVQKVNLILEGANDMERLSYREEIINGNKLLASAAKQSGVVNYALFQDAGYRGLYNSGIKIVKKKKGISDSADHFDFMGRTELAANLFRITLTEEKLKSTSINSERIANDIHSNVGKQIRKMVKDNTGYNPEDLPIERRLSNVKSELKKATKKLNNGNTD